MCTTQQSRERIAPCIIVSLCVYVCMHACLLACLSWLVDGADVRDPVPHISSYICLVRSRALTWGFV